LLAASSNAPFSSPCHPSSSARTTSCPRKNRASGLALFGVEQNLHATAVAAQELWANKDVMHCSRQQTNLPKLVYGEPCRGARTRGNRQACASKHHIPPSFPFPIDGAAHGSSPYYLVYPESGDMPCTAPGRGVPSRPYAGPVTAETLAQSRRRPRKAAASARLRVKLAPIPAPIA